MKNSKSVVIKGELFWTRDMNNFNTKFNPDNTKYQCTIGNLSDVDAKKLEDLGVKIKQKDTQGKFIVAKSNYLFTPFDSKGKPVEIEALGNGSKVTAEVTSYEHRMTAAHGMAPSIKKLTVNEVITYNPEAVAELDDVL
jgi:hypothetical protein